MAVVKIHAIILKSYETGNSSEVVHILCAEFGRYSVYARGLRRQRSRFAAILQPLSLVELTLSAKDGAEMATLRDAAPLTDHSALTSDMERFSLALVLAEVAAASCNAAQAAPEIFAALVQALHDLDPRSGEPAMLAACRAMLTILAAAGYEPQIDEALLHPWPAERAKPQMFWLEMENARVHSQGSHSLGDPHWPMRIAPAARHFPLPPQAVRFIHNVAHGRQVVLASEHAAQLFEGLVRLAEYHHESGIKSANFWREISGTP
ncbi:DNA repair protein RecO [Candidatus Sumerlaeota bacterium]|nr:DNA repair protein RecO [Candidatus Sumerlaeota bacterium]